MDSEQLLGLVSVAVPIRNRANHTVDGRNSPFTSALLTHLLTPGMEIGSVMKRVRADVVQATRGKQIPWDHSSLIGEVVLAQ